MAKGSVMSLGALEKHFSWAQKKIFERIFLAVFVHPCEQDHFDNRDISRLRNGKGFSSLKNIK